MVGYLILPTGDEALGTIGNARQWGVTASATLPLDALLPGARLTADGSLGDSRLRDRLTGSVRRMDDIPARGLSVEFRHDLPLLRSSWGMNFAAAKRADVFYNREILTWREMALWGAYFETTVLPGFKATLSVSAIGGADDFRLRRFYDPSRTGPPAGSETRNQHQGAVVSIMLARQL